jgi:hypothetical protein
MTFSNNKPPPCRGHRTAGGRRPPG